MDLLLNKSGLVELKDEEMMEVEGGIVPVIIGAYALLPVAARVHTHLKNVYRSEYNKEMKYLNSKYGN